jgi:hypothetical protein
MTGLLIGSTGPTPPPGVYQSIPAHTYHNAWNAASNSRLTKLRKSPAHLKAYLDEPGEDTLALKVGRALHTAILEPDEFASTFAVADQCHAMKKGDGLRCTNNAVGFSSRDGWLCGVHSKGVLFDESRIVITGDSYTTCLRVRDNVHVHGAAKGILSLPRAAELSLRWDDVETGLACKARLDCSTPELVRGTIWDVKSTVDASEREFTRSIFKYGYHRQGAFYLDGSRRVGIPAEHFTIVAVEKESPYAVAVYRLDDGAIDAGRQQLRPLINRYDACLKANTWPGYSNEVRDISLPDWAWKQISEESVEEAA